jgi:hypothetical protein
MYNLNQILFATKKTLVVIAILTITILSFGSQAQTKAKPKITKFESVNINSDYQQVKYYSDKLRIEGTGEPNSKIDVLSYPNSPICIGLLVDASGNWFCDVMNSNIVDGKQIGVEQDNEPQNFGNTIFTQRSKGTLDFNIYLDLDNNGVSNCSPEMSCYAPDTSLVDDELRVDIQDSSNNYIIQNCLYDWFNKYQCKLKDGEDVYSFFKIDPLNIKVYKYKIHIPSKFQLGKNLPNVEKQKYPGFQYGKLEGEFQMSKDSNYISVDLGLVNKASQVIVPNPQNTITKPTTISTPRTGGIQNFWILAILLFSLTNYRLKLK